MERAYISGGGAPEIQQISADAARRAGVQFPGDFEGAINIETGQFLLQINNYGKTPARLIEYGIGWCDAGAIPERPTYEWTYFRDWIQPGRGTRTIARIRIPTEFSRPVIYGRFRYLDIFNAPHSEGFIQRGGTPILAPRAFNESDPAWDLPNVYEHPRERDG